MSTQGAPEVQRAHGEPETECDTVPERTGGSLGSRLADRRWPILATILMLLAGMLFMFCWNPVVHHYPTWNTGDDLWGIFRGAHYVGWGFLGGIYTPSNGIISLPGMSVLLAPVAVLSGHLHLTESYPPDMLAHPTAALLLQPIVLLLASTTVFASDALAQRLGVMQGRRAHLWFIIAIVAWPTAAVWGHPEDALAMTFAIYAMVAMLDRKWSRCGWLLGVGIVLQPLVALMLPLFIGATPRGKRVVLTVRSAVLSVVLVGVALAGNAGETYEALVMQPTPPSLNHATPWVALAPKLNAGTTVTARHAGLVHRLGQSAFTQWTSTVHGTVNVAGGPGRSIDVAVALLFGLYVWRRPQHSVRLLWLAATVLASRCFFEAVMTPYYIAPPLFLALVLAARQGGRRFWAAVVIALEITVFSYHHLNPWAWWLPIVSGLAVILALGYPDDLAATRESPSDASLDSLSFDPAAHVSSPARSLEPAH
jgi:hypothetical protein